jgi:hypothetical protein
VEEVGGEFVGFVEGWGGVGFGCFGPWFLILAQFPGTVDDSNGLSLLGLGPRPRSLRGLVECKDGSSVRWRWESELSENRRTTCDMDRHQLADLLTPHRLNQQTIYNTNLEIDGAQRNNHHPPNSKFP